MGNKIMAALPLDFVNLLNTYKENLASYRVTGNVAYKTAYENAARALDQKLGTVQGQLMADSQYVQNFLGQYSNANSTLQSLQQKTKEIKQVGPQLQDQYIKTQKLNTVPLAPIDYTGLYVKGGILLGVFIIAGLAAAT
jgi:hypothetical protein